MSGHFVNMGGTAGEIDFHSSCPCFSGARGFFCCFDNKVIIIGNGGKIYEKHTLQNQSFRGIYSETVV